MGWYLFISAERACEEPLRFPEPLQQCGGVHAACGAAPKHLPLVLCECFTLPLVMSLLAAGMLNNPFIADMGNNNLHGALLHCA